MTVTSYSWLPIPDYLVPIILMSIRRLCHPSDWFQFNPYNFQQESVPSIVFFTSSCLATVQASQIYLTMSQLVRISTALTTHPESSVKCPDVLPGYNIFSFHLRFLLTRASCGCNEDYDRWRRPLPLYHGPYLQLLKLCGRLTILYPGFDDIDVRNATEDRETKL